MELKSCRLDGDFEDVELGYVDWGPPDADQTIVCAHGLTRNAGYFDRRAAAGAAGGARVLAVDVVGRGRSSWLKDPEGYAIPLYVQHLTRFLQIQEFGPVDWVGTSMGGLIGMVMAVGDDAKIHRLVLNDVGPFIPKAALAQIKAYLGLNLMFPDLDALEQHLRQIHAPFGPLSDDEWRHLATQSAREDEDGWRLSYDPKIRVPQMTLPDDDIDLWPLYEKIRCPVYVMRGGDSVLLQAETAYQMTRRGPRARLHTVDGVGHAPALMDPAQIAVIQRWLPPE
jgi:pimeloyl-ACP methyl ester carboxylesterase